MAAFHLNDVRLYHLEITESEDELNALLRTQKAASSKERIQYLSSWAMSMLSQCANNCNKQTLRHPMAMTQGITKESLIISHQVDISASQAAVWAILSDLTAYPQWNPALQPETVPARLQAGVQIRLCAAPNTAYKRFFTAEILDVIPPAVLVWQGGQAGVFEGIHCFELEPLGPNQTRLLNSESFRGEQAADILQMSYAILEAEFITFNQALKYRVESTNGSLA